MAVRGVDQDPLRNFKFKVEIQTFGVIGFSSVSGLKEQTEIVEYREGTDRSTPRKLFGQTTFDNVVCENGLTNDVRLLTWRRDIFDPTKGQNLGAEGAGLGGAGGLRRLVTITLGDYHERGTWEWVLRDAWPATWEVSDLAGDGNDVVMQKLEFTHEGMTAGAKFTR